MKVPTGTGTVMPSTDFKSKETTKEKEEQILSDWFRLSLRGPNNTQHP